jgi:uncharacterized protein (DUF983 family)
MQDKGWSFGQFFATHISIIEIVDQLGLDVFGHGPGKRAMECICPNCGRNMAASRFAPHLEKCMGMGRNSSRIASRRYFERKFN